MELEYVRGFFDRLCYVDDVGRAIVLTTNQVDLGRRVAAKLRTERINCSMKEMTGSRLKLRVSGKESLSRWAEVVGFLDPTKQDKLLQILESYGGADGGPEPAEEPDQAELEEVPGEPRGEDRGVGPLPLPEPEP